MKYSKTASITLYAAVLLLTLSSFGIFTAVVTPNTLTATAATVPVNAENGKLLRTKVTVNPNMPGLSYMTAAEFLSLTPARYRQMTGKKLGFFKSMELKMAQRQMKKKMDEGGDLPQWAYIVMAIFWLGWLAIGVRSNWKGNDWWITLLLYFLFWIPGIVYALIVMDKYY